VIAFISSRGRSRDEINEFVKMPAVDSSEMVSLRRVAIRTTLLNRSNLNRTNYLELQ